MIYEFGEMRFYGTKEEIKEVLGYLFKTGLKMKDDEIKELTNILVDKKERD